VESQRIGGQFGVVKGLQEGIGPPPPGTLLGMLLAIMVLLGLELPAMAAATTRVRAVTRINNFISRSPFESLIWGRASLERGIRCPRRPGIEFKELSVQVFRCN
jgi:hypothetical protein